MAKTDTARRRRNPRSEGPLYTLTEVAQKTGISMPTLQRYKRLYQSRIPSVGKGRKQRYPEAALAVFQQIKEENLARRGRPPKKGVRGRRRTTRKTRQKKAAAGGRARKSRRAKRAARAAGTGEELLTLTEISKRTGISYPTLVRYVKLYRDQIPYKGRGRKRRFYPEAVEVFRELRQTSGRGRGRRAKKAKRAGRGRRRAAPAGAERLARRVEALEASQKGLQQEIKALIKKLEKPIKVKIGG